MRRFRRDDDDWVRWRGWSWFGMRGGLAVWLLVALGAGGRDAVAEGQDRSVLDLTVPVSAGTTRLADIGLYRVFYQSYTGKPVEMPLAWMGHFDEPTGISYTAWSPVLGREVLLLHSPWRVPAGRTWVEYRLRLPSTSPIRLSFGIAMGPDVATPEKSDGVTFSCRITDDQGQERELMRQHHDRGEWRDYRLDLSAEAGKVVTLALQVEPGPRNSASFDYSFFGEARIVVGAEGQDDAGARLERFVARKAYQVQAAAAVRSLINDPSRGVLPGVLLRARTDLEPVGDAWRFRYRGKEGELVYTYVPRTGTLDDLSVQVDGDAPFLPALGGGVTLVAGAGDGRGTGVARGGRVVALTRRSDALEVEWEYPTGVRVEWRLRLVGKALEIAARCAEPTVSEFSLGLAAAALRRPVNVPYLLGSMHYLPVEGVFAGRYLDWTRSHASTAPQGLATYAALTDGSRNRLEEVGYVAVSTDLNEVLPNLPHPVSPFVGVLGPCVMLDLWGHAGGTYAGDAELIRTLKDHGVDHLVIIQHDWQHFGYDVKLPDHLPANPRYGGDAGLIEFGRAARACGYRWSLHENYIDLYPDAPSYDATARVLRADGSASPAWYNPGTRVQSYGLKCTRALGYARQNSPEAHRRYGTTAAYLDVHSCVPPWHQLDHEAGQSGAGLALTKVIRDTELFQFERETHGGPLFGEGNNHFYWGGRVDGVEAQVAGGEDHVPYLDFDLLKLHPQMVNHGMGYYERWYRRGYDAQWGVDAGSSQSLDKYRAQELAYGHAGFIGAALTASVQHVWREHHLMHPVQRLYGSARPVEIRYQVDRRWVTGSAALVAGPTDRQRIRYDSGLTLWVNWRPEAWRIEAGADECRLAGQRFRGPRTPVRLPQWGFLAVGPGTLAYTALQGDHVVDYAECPEFVFADARTHLRSPYRRGVKDLEPRLRAFEDLGGGRVRVTYEWHVNDTLDQDYRCFVHAVHPAESGTDGIVFQQDHALPKPTRQWAKGEVVVDGPYDMQVSERFDRYDLVMGLFGDARVRLKGVQRGDSRILVTRLLVERRDGKIERVRAEPLSAAGERSTESIEADFTAHTNPVGTWMAGEALATDGAVKVNREARKLVVFPCPREVGFGVRLGLDRLVPGVDGRRLRSGRGEGRGLQVRALAAGSQAELGEVPFEVQEGELRFSVGGAGVGRYVIEW